MNFRPSSNHGNQTWQWIIFPLNPPFTWDFPANYVWLPKGNSKINLEDAFSLFFPSLEQVLTMNTAMLRWKHVQPSWFMTQASTNMWTPGPTPAPRAFDRPWPTEKWPWLFHKLHPDSNRSYVSLPEGTPTSIFLCYFDITRRQQFHFPMGFPWFFLWSSYDFPMFFHDFPMMSHGFSMVFYGFHDQSDHPNPSQPYVGPPGCRYRCVFGLVPRGSAACVGRLLQLAVRLALAFSLDLGPWRFMGWSREIGHGNHWKTMGNHRKTIENHRKTMGNQRKTKENQRKNNRKNMDKTQESHGNTIIRKTVGRSWRFCLLVRSK